MSTVASGWDRLLGLLMVAGTGLFVLADLTLMLGRFDAFDGGGRNADGSVGPGLVVHAGWLVIVGVLGWRVFRAARIPDPGAPRLLPEYQ